MSIVSDGYPPLPVSKAVYDTYIYTMSVCLLTMMSISINIDNIISMRATVKELGLPTSPLGSIVNMKHKRVDKNCSFKRSYSSLMTVKCHGVS